MVRLTPYHEQQPVTVSDPQQLAVVVAQAFSQRRKTLRNNFRNLLSGEQIQDAGIDPGTRPEQLSLEEYAILSNLVYYQRDNNGRYLKFKTFISHRDFMSRFHFSYATPEL